MTEALEKLVHALREELTHYGEMLVLLERQQETATHRMTDEMFAATAAIRNHSLAMLSARRTRELRQRDVARELCVLESSTFVELLPLLPPAYRPLVFSLVEENNDLLGKVSHRARQNHLILSRSVELMQQFISALIPTPTTQVYNDRGDSRAAPIPSPPLYEAVG